MARHGRWPGTWAAICDRCGFRYPSEDLRKEWDNLMVCHSCWEPRHPQDFIRGIPDNPAPDWVRPEPADDLILICDIVTSSAYVGLAVADCAQADNTTYTYAFLVDVNAGFY